MLTSLLSQTKISMCTLSRTKETLKGGFLLAEGGLVGFVEIEQVLLRAANSPLLGTP